MACLHVALGEWVFFNTSRLRKAQGGRTGLGHVGMDVSHNGLGRRLPVLSIAIKAWAKHAGFNERPHVPRIPHYGVVNVPSTALAWE